MFYYYHVLLLELDYESRLFVYMKITMSAASSSEQYDLGSFKFQHIKESNVAREMIRRYMTDTITYADTDVVICGLVLLVCLVLMSLVRTPMFRYNIYLCYLHCSIMIKKTASNCNRLMFTVTSIFYFHMM